MGLIPKSYEFRLYPNTQQKELLAKHFGACRYIYNLFIDIRQEAYIGENRSMTYVDTANQLVLIKKEEGNEWMKEINSQSMQSSLKHLDIGIKKFIRGEAGYPKFKNRFSEQSFTVPQNVSINEEGKFSIPKFKEGINIKIHQKIEGKILFATIKRSLTGKYHVSITCEVMHKELPPSNSSVGIDTGLKSLAILSDGKVYDNIKPLKEKLKELQFACRQLSKKKKGGQNRKKQKTKVARIYEKITNTRKDFLHKVSTEIIRNHGVICVESLAIKNLMKNHKLSRAFADVALGEFYRMLEYKAAWNGRTFVKIGCFFPSSKKCSDCDWIKEDLTLADREWTCCECGTHHDRDINAAINILIEGLRLLEEMFLLAEETEEEIEIGCGSGNESQDKQKHGEALPIGRPTTHEAQPIGFAVGG